jgi:hypothetical protein
MPLVVPVLDDRNFDQLFSDTVARIPSFTPEWNNYGLDSDPGITLVQLFAFLADAMLYRVNRYPDTNRLKFLHLLGVPLRPASPASGIVSISNDRGPAQALPLEPGIQVGAGSVDFVTVEPLDVLPVAARIFYKAKVTDPSANQTYQTQYEAILLAAEAAAAGDGDPTAASAAAASVQLVFYETQEMTAPTAANPNPIVDLVNDTIDNALYIALLARPQSAPADAAGAIANETLSIGVVPSVTGTVAPLQPLRLGTATTPTSNLVFEIPANPGTDVAAAQYRALTPLAAPDVLNATGIVQLPLPAASSLGTWSFTDPMSEGTEDFPPKIDDPTVDQSVVTWVRIRLIPPAGAAGVVQSAKITWLGINAASVYQAVSVVNELVGTASGEPDQSYRLANAPVLSNTVTVVTQDLSGSLPATTTAWALTDDLISAARTDKVFALDPEAAQITFGDGIHGDRPAAATRIFASYQYGGGPQGNVAIGAISSSRDPRLLGGYTIANPVPTSGGDSGQDVTQAESEIPQIIRHKDRLVTLQDFADVTMQTPGVDFNRVDVVPLFNPGPPPLDNAPGVVTLMVLPQTDPTNPLWPTPDRLFLGRVCDYLDTRRLVTTEIYVRGPDYVPVYISVGIAVQGGYFPDLVRQSVSDGLRQYLSSLNGFGPNGAGWPLRKNLLAKDLEAAATRIDGVEYVDSLLLGVNSATEIVEFDFTGLQLPRLDGLSVVQGTALPLASVLGAAAPAQPGISIVPVPVVKAKC